MCSKHKNPDPMFHEYKQARSWAIPRAGVASISPRVFNSGRGKKSEPTDKTDISGISGFFIFIFIFLFFYLFFNLLFSIKNIH